MSKKILVLVVVASFLAGCVTPTGKSFTGPTGTIINSVKCNVSPDGCFEHASKICSGPYKVISSESHAGGLVADLLPGPVTWYGMTFECGKSDGSYPTFALKGNAPAMPDIKIPQPVITRPTTTNCYTFGKTTSCSSY